MTFGPLFIREAKRAKLCQPRIHACNHGIYHWHDRNFGSNTRDDQQLCLHFVRYIDLSTIWTIYFTSLKRVYYSPRFLCLFFPSSTLLLSLRNPISLQFLAHTLYQNVSSGTGFDESNPAKRNLRKLCRVLRRIMTTFRVPSLPLWQPFAINHCLYFLSLSLSLSLSLPSLVLSASHLQYLANKNERSVKRGKLLASKLPKMSLVDASKAAHAATRTKTTSLYSFDCTL